LGIEITHQELQDGYQGRIELRSPTDSSMESIYSLIKNSLARLSDQEDQLIWSFSPTGKYSPKLGYLAQSKLIMWILLHGGGNPSGS
jgi:hypothetical protein